MAIVCFQTADFSSSFVIKSWLAVNKSLFSLLLAYLSPIASELHALWNPSRQEYWYCAACSLQDSHCDQNATQNISSDHNCSASEQEIGCFLVYLWRAQLGIWMYRLHARFSLNILLPPQVLKRNMFSLCVYNNKKIFLKLHDKLCNIHSARLL